MSDPLFSPNAIHVLKLVSGLPKPARERRLIVVLQAFIDDSRTDGSILVLSGFISDTVSWAKFSDEWQELLDGLRWPRFKMSELALGGGDITTEYAEWFYRVAEKHSKAQFAVAIEEQLLSRLVDEMMLPDFYKNPYFIAFPILIDGLMQTQRRMDLWEPVDIIFDKQDQIEDAILHNWAEFTSTLRGRHKRVLGSRPRFEKDEDFLPLQAADLSAWWLRRYWTGHKAFHPSGTIYPWMVKGRYEAMMIYPREATLCRRLDAHKSDIIKQMWEKDSSDIELRDVIPDHVWDFRDFPVKLKK